MRTSRQFAALLLFASAVTGFAESRDVLPLAVTNRFGDVFTNLAVAQALPDGLVLEHAAGQMKVKYDDLPPWVRKKYQALAVADAEQRQEQTKANAAFFAQQQKLQAEQAKINQARAQASDRPEKASASLKTKPAPAKPAQNFPDDTLKSADGSWTITFLMAGLRGADRTAIGDQTLLYGYPGENGFNLSIWMGEARTHESRGHEEVYQYREFWPLASKNAAIDAGSVLIENKGRFVKISYTTYGGTIPHVYYYFAFKEKWGYVHISKSKAEPSDRQLFADFESHLKYE